MIGMHSSLNIAYFYRVLMNGATLVLFQAATASFDVLYTIVHISDQAVVKSLPKLLINLEVGYCRLLDTY